MFLLLRGGREEGDMDGPQKTKGSSHLPVLFLGLHDDEIPLVINLFVQEIIIFLEEEIKM